MSVEVRIPQKGIFKKKLKIEDIINRYDLSFGISDVYYCLQENQIGEHTLVYDQKKLARGIDVSFLDNDIVLLLSLPTSMDEIEFFYHLVSSICKDLNRDTFIRDQNEVSLNDLDLLITYDRCASMDALSDLKTKFSTGEYTQFFIFGIIHPLSIGLNEMNEFGNDLHKLGDYLERMQRMDVYYASPKLYQMNENIIGTYAVGPYIDTVVPIKPYLFTNQYQISEWFIITERSTLIPYDYFIDHIHNKKDYDSSHYLLSATQEEIYDIIYNHQRNDHEYFCLGRIIDMGSNHSHKIKDKQFQLEEITGYNHLAILLRWCQEHNLLSERLLNECPSLLDNNQDYRQIIYNERIFLGALRLEHFNEIGQDFIKEYYIFNRGHIDYYPHCVDMYAMDYFGREKYNSEEFKDEAYLFVPYDEDYYQGLSQYIDRAWQIFKSHQSGKG